MTRIKTAGLGLVALSTVSGVLAASAVALPEFTGPFPKPFTSTSKVSVLESVAKAKVKCAADTDTGEVTGPTGGTIVIRFTGCESAGFPCNSSGAASGEIVTRVLTATLGYISREPREVGLDIANPAGAVVAEFQCVNLIVVVRGSAIGKITPINKTVKPPSGHFTLKFVEKAGKQAIMKFEAGPVDVLKGSFGGGPFELSGLKSTDLIYFGAPLQIIA